MSKQFLICVLGLFISAPAFSQDISFSQFNLFNSYYNPALAGNFEGNVKVSLINRDHWVRFTETPYRSLGVNGDIKFDLKRGNLQKDFLALSAYFLTDRGQLLDWNKNEMGIGLVFHKRLDKSRKTYLSGGLGVGLLQRSLSYDNIYFQDQFDGLDKYNNPTREILPVNIHTTPDLKFGVGFSTRLSPLWSLQSGTGIHYIFRPNFSFFRNLEDINYRGLADFKALIRTNTIVNFIYQLSKSESLIPKFHLSTQGPHSIIQLGTGYRKSFYSLNQTAFHAGLAVRSVGSVDYFTPVDLGLQIGFEIKNFIIGLQYDIGLRDAIKYSNPTHSYEIGISWIGNYDNQGFICPKF